MTHSTSKTLVTGISGFVGLHLAKTLVARGDRVVGLVRPTSRVDRLEALGVEFVTGDVTDPASLRKAVSGVDLVIHLAGLVKAFSREEFVRVNEQGTRNVAAACRDLTTPPVLVVISSLAAAGPSTLDRPRREEDPAAPVSHYGHSKLAGERAAAEFSADIPVTIVRPPIVFGEYDPNSLEMFRPIARPGIHVVPGFRQRSVALIHAADLSAGLVLAADRGARLAPVGDATSDPGQGYYFFADDEQPNYADLGRRIGVALGRRRVRVVRVPEWTSWSVATASEMAARLRGRPSILNRDKIREATAGSWICSVDRARDELGFRPAASLDERLRQTAESYRQSGQL